MAVEELTALIALAVAAAHLHGLDPDLFCRLIEQESDWDVRAVSKSGCLGLGQINRAAWDWWPNDPFNAMQNVGMSSYILQWNMAYRADQAPGEREWQAVASYNLGHGRVNRLLAEHGDGWREALPEATRRYVEAIVERMSYTLETLESDAWALLQPLDLWSYQRGDCWTLGDYGPFQLMASGDSFEEARDAYCRALIENAEFAERRGMMYDDYIRRVNNIPSGEDKDVAERID